jgi:hypothetical protein
LLACLRPFPPCGLYSAGATESTKGMPHSLLACFLLPRDEYWMSTRAGKIHAEYGEPEFVGLKPSFVL